MTAVRTFLLAAVFTGFAVSAAELFYCLQPTGKRAAFPETAVRTGRTHFVLDESFDGSPGERWTAAEMAQFKTSRAVLLCYLSIGEAEDYRSYWHREWKRRPPAFLLAENPRWKGNFTVRYWDRTWQEIMLGELERIARSGFDGAYLDIVDGYEFFEQRAGKEFAVNPATGRTYREDMILLVLRLAERGRAIRPGFQIFIQNGEALLADARLLRAVDGLAVEDLFTDGKKMQPEAEVRARLKYVRLARQAEKTCFAVEYPPTGRRGKVAALGRKYGLDLLMTDRELKTPGVSCPAEPRRKR